jgi:hypothetical protein
MCFVVADCEMTVETTAAPAILPKPIRSRAVRPRPAAGAAAQASDLLEKGGNEQVDQTVLPKTKRARAAPPRPAAASQVLAQDLMENWGRGEEEVAPARRAPPRSLVALLHRATATPLLGQGEEQVEEEQVEEEEEILREERHCEEERPATLRASPPRDADQVVGGSL